MEDDVSRDFREIAVESLSFESGTVDHRLEADTDEGVGNCRISLVSKIFVEISVSVFRVGEVVRFSRTGKGTVRGRGDRLARGGGDFLGESTISSSSKDSIRFKAEFLIFLSESKTRSNSR